jgi:lysozyme
MPAPVANGVDCFHGDNNEAMPDFAAMKMQGIKFFWHKISQGNNYRDPKAVARIAAARSAGLLVGGYHFLTNADVVSQRGYFYQCCNQAGMGGNDQLACDFERSGSATPTPEEAYDFTSGLQITFGRPLSPWIYGSDLVREMPATIAKQFAGFKLWLAEYGPSEVLPAPWTDATKSIWQFTESGNVRGITGHVDLNICTGDIASLWKNGESANV